MKDKPIAALFLCCIALLLAGCGQSGGSEEELPEPSFLEYRLDPDTSFKEVYGIDYKTAEGAWLEALMGMRET